MGPVNQKTKLIITYENFPARTGWYWRYKRPGERDYVLVGPVKSYKTNYKSLAKALKALDLVSDIL